VQDEQGRWLVDANNNFAVLALGHANESVTAAVHDAARDGTCFGLPTPWEEHLAEMLVARVAHAEQARFTNSGTEAVMTAVRLARSLTGRAKILGVAGSYHGSSDVALAIKAGVDDPAGPDVTTVPLNDVGRLETAFEKHGSELAMVMLDLLPNYAGFEPVADDFLVRARQLCDEHGALLVFDEVISFRLARGGLQSARSVSPDITVLGKLIGGGLPIGAVLGAENVLRPLSPVSGSPIESSGTFTGNPISIRAGIACLQQYDDPQIARLNGLGEALLAGLVGQLPPEWAVRGVGSLVRVVPPARVASVPPGHALWWAAYRRGFVLMPSGLMSLSSPMNEEVVGRLVEAVLESVEEAASMSQHHE
jgi:glutamate-1-semialdehyde 2,1-aminomutase